MIKIHHFQKIVSTNSIFLHSKIPKFRFRLDHYLRDEGDEPELIQNPSLKFSKAFASSSSNFRPRINHDSSADGGVDDSQTDAAAPTTSFTNSTNTSPTSRVNKWKAQNSVKFQSSSSGGHSQSGNTLLPHSSSSGQPPSSSSCQAPSSSSYQPASSSRTPSFVDTNTPPPPNRTQRGPFDSLLNMKPKTSADAVDEPSTPDLRGQKPTKVTRTVMPIIDAPPEDWDGEGPPPVREKI